MLSIQSIRKATNCSYYFAVLQLYNTTLALVCFKIPFTFLCPSTVFFVFFKCVASASNAILVLVYNAANTQKMLLQQQYFLAKNSCLKFMNIVAAVDDVLCCSCAVHT